MAYDQLDFVPVAPVKDEVRDAILAARDRITKRWCKGALLKPGGAVCILGGLGLRGVVFTTPLQKQAIKRCVKFLPDWAEGSLPDFNDDNRTTKADVIALLTRAAGEG